MAESDKTMFEIYRETGYNSGFHCIFYTDLEEHARDKQITKAANGETVFSGFVRDDEKEQARGLVESIVDELNDLSDDEPAPPADDISRRLERFLVP